MSNLERITQEAAQGQHDVSLFVNGVEIMRRPEVEIDSDGDVSLYFAFEAPNYSEYSRKVACA